MKHLDVELERARVLHRIVRAMHDGECPSCHIISASSEMRVPEIGNLRCRNCGFAISNADEKAAIAEFAPVMAANLAIFEQWRTERAQAVDRIVERATPVHKWGAEI